MPRCGRLRSKATPTGIGPSHERVRRDRIDDSGVVTLRHHGRLHHIGIGRTHARTHVLLLIQDLHIRIINAATGELLRELTLDPTRDYQRQHRPQTRNRAEPVGSACLRCPETSQRVPPQDSNLRHLFRSEVR